MTRDAAGAYAAARERVQNRVLRLQDLLNAHAAKQQTAPANWGYAGDLGHAVEVLDELIAFMGGAKETST